MRISGVCCLWHNRSDSTAPPTLCVGDCEPLERHRVATPLGVLHVFLDAEQQDLHGVESSLDVWDTVEDGERFPQVFTEQWLQTQKQQIQSLCRITVDNVENTRKCQNNSLSGSRVRVPASLQIQKQVKSSLQIPVLNFAFRITSCVLVHRRELSVETDPSRLLVNRMKCTRTRPIKNIPHY